MWVRTSVAMRMQLYGKPAWLTNVITIFALVFGMAFGICSVAGISLSRGGNARSAHLLIETAAVMGAICVVSLLIVAAFAYVRARCATRYPSNP